MAVTGESGVHLSIRLRSSKGTWGIGCDAQEANVSYGTTFAALSKLHPKRCVLDIDLQGVKQLHVRGPKQNPPLAPVFLFLSPPSVSQLKSRLSGRGTETEESMRKRLDAAKAEIEHALTGAHEVVIVNDDIERAGKLLEAVALGTEGWEKICDQLPELNVAELD